MKRIVILTLVSFAVLGTVQSINQTLTATGKARTEGAEIRNHANLLRAQTLSEYYGYDPAQLVLSGGEPPQKNLLEPSVMFLLGLGMIGLASFRRRFKG